MSDLHPITCPDLLKEADKIIQDHELAVLYRSLVTDLTSRGVTVNQFMIAGDIAAYFVRLGLPTYPREAMSIFLGLEGEAGLNKIIARWADLGLN